jgi:hemolysin III
MSRACDRLTLGPLQNPVRGLLHGPASLVALGLAIQFTGQSQLDPLLRAALVAFAVTQTALFSTSALYHSLPWTPIWKRRMQRLDHAMIFFAIAGSVTPLALVAFEGPPRILIPLFSWAIACAGAAQKAFLPRIHERASIPVQLVQATLGAPALVAFAAGHPGTPVALAFLGAAAYGIGAIVFLTERPLLWPRVFSFHELFHLLVVAGSAAHLALITGWLVRVP